MCGITGFWDKENSFDQTVIRAMISQLHHRGPDGVGFYFGEDDEPTLAHSRLSIIDLKTGTQPLFSSDGSLVLVVNGELYDYKKTRAIMASRGYQFQTKSDSEIIFPLYLEYGLDFVKHLRGEFSFSLYDKKRKRLILCRDRFGIRPLFFYHNKNRFYFASEIKSILNHPSVSTTFSKKAMLHQMIQVSVPGMTLFEGVQSVLPGHYLTVDLEGDRFKVRQSEYWDFNYPQQGEHRYDLTESQTIDRVKSTLIESVHLRLEADVPVACYLSGGIDSCSILGLSSLLQQSPVRSFTIGFSNTPFDEQHIAKIMASRVSSNHDILEVSMQDLYGDNYLKALWHSEKTFYNTLGVAKMLLSQHVSKSGYRVVLTGEGADEIFGGYTAFKKDMLLHGDNQSGMLSNHQLQSSLAKSDLFKGSILPETMVNHVGFSAVCGFTPTWVQPWLLVWNQLKGLLSDSFLEEIGDYDPFQAIIDSLNAKKIAGRHALDIAQYTWSKTMLEGQILNWGGDRVDMANSLESRPPFLDHHLVELATSIPPEMRVKNTTEKWVLREAMRYILPKELYEREKFSFMAPPAISSKQTQQESVWKLVEKHLTHHHLNRVGLMESDQFASFIDRCRHTQDSALQFRLDIILNHLIGLHALHDLFLQKTAIVN